MKEPHHVYSTWTHVCIATVVRVASPLANERWPDRKTDLRAAYHRHHDKVWRLYSAGVMVGEAATREQALAFVEEGVMS